MDAKYPHFSSENKNIRLGVAADGFSPFRTMTTAHSTWPIILVNYNLPPWLCMKPEFFFFWILSRESAHTLLLKRRKNKEKNYKQENHKT